MFYKPNSNLSVWPTKTKDTIRNSNCKRRYFVKICNRCLSVVGQLRKNFINCLFMKMYIWIVFILSRLLKTIWMILFNSWSFRQPDLLKWICGSYCQIPKIITGSNIEKGYMTCVGRLEKSCLPSYLLIIESITFIFLFYFISVVNFLLEWAGFKNFTKVPNCLLIPLKHSIIFSTYMYQ